MTDGYGINASGQVTGDASTPGNAADQAFLYSNGAMKDLGTLGGTFSQGNGVNDKGQVTGVSYIAGNPEEPTEHAFLYSNGHMIDLNSLISSDMAALYTLTSGMAINDSGQILVDGYIDYGGETRAFLLTPTTSPVPDSASAWLLLSGLGWLGVFNRKRLSAATRIAYALPALLVRESWHYVPPFRLHPYRRSFFNSKSKGSIVFVKYTKGAKLMKRLYTGLTVLSLAVLTPPVFATSIATATLTDLTVTLTSTDGGTPSISFSTPHNYSYIEGFVTEPTNTSYSYFVNPTGANAVSTPLGSATSSITGNGTFATLTSTNFIASASATGSGSVTTTSVGEAGTYTPFTLGPDTTAMFSSTGSVSANTTDPGDNAQAYAYLQVAGSSSGTTFIISSSQSVYYFASGQNGTDQSQSGAMDVDIVNPTSADLTGYLYAYTNTEAVSVVPEPSTYALMAAGLGLFGVVSARRRRCSILESSV